VLSILPSDDKSPKPFRCETREVHGTTLVCPQGELDLATAPAIDAELKRLFDAGTEEVVLDLRGLTFLDSSGLRLLVTWTRSAQQHDGTSFAVIQGPDVVERVIAMAALDDMLPFVDAERFAGEPTA
jgi:anti-sigma B factor antagonist